MFYHSEGIFTEEMETKIREKLQFIENKIKKWEEEKKPQDKRW